MITGDPGGYNKYIPLDGLFILNRTWNAIDLGLELGVEVEKVILIMFEY